MASEGNKVVIITGAGTGIGQAAAIQFVRSGYNVVITGRTRSTLETTAQMCKDQAANNPKICIVTGDIVKPDDNTRVVNEAIRVFRRIDTLVNNAGFGTGQRFLSTTLEDLDTMYNVHVRGVFDLTQKVMPHLLETKGSVVNVSSAAGLIPMTADVSYSIMKACLDHLTRILSVDYGRKGVRVNSVNPAVVRTQFATSTIGIDEDQRDQFMEWFATSQPIGRVGETKEVADLIVFLASDNATFITGANVPIDGGVRNTSASPKSRL